MLKEIRFQNFRVLQKAKLPLSRVTILAGANGSGKSTVLQALYLLSTHREETKRTDERTNYENLVSANNRTADAPIEVRFVWDTSDEKNMIRLRWEKAAGGKRGSDKGISPEMNDFAARVRVFSLVASEIAAPVQIAPDLEVGSTGRRLAGVLDNMNDTTHERFEALNTELPNWLPEYDRVKFETRPGAKSLCLRRRVDGLSISAADLSEGTLFALTLLTLAYLPTPPSLVALEHPDSGIHPRLLRKVQDAIYRLAFPESHGESRAPTQVIATTHSPYFLDLFKEHPDEIVFANKNDAGVEFQRLSDRPNVSEILPDGPLGDLWYSGLLGGVPANP